MSKISSIALSLSIAFALPVGSYAQEADHEEETSLEISVASQDLAGIVVETLHKKDISDEIRAPGEVKLNTYLSGKVTPRVDAQILERHVHLGDHVVKGQSLVTLSSVDVARAVSDLLVADKEWMRIRQMSASVVSTKRRSEAKIEREQALAIAKAYGVSDELLDATLKAGVTDNPGAFQLHAMQDGVVVSDDFVLGELAVPGQVLFDLVDETLLWVESSLSPEEAENIEVGARARVKDGDDAWHEARVIQKHHKLDEETRTIGIRLEVANSDDHLHAGMYVDTRLETRSSTMALAVPSSAVLQSSDGDWVIFVEEEPGHFTPLEVEVIADLGGFSVLAGVEEGARFATKGAFFLQSELAKGGFDVHNH